jgi:hypothetical protein
MPDQRQLRHRSHRTLRFESLETRTLLSGSSGTIATLADVSYPYAVAVDNAENLFIAEAVQNMVFEINHATGAITAVAGNGGQGYSGDGGQATAAELCSPCGVALDNAGDLFIADLGNNRVREVNLSSGVITTVAGNGTLGNSGDGGQATAAEIGPPSGVAVDSAGNLFIADVANSCIREVDLSSGVITTVAGNGNSTCSGDGGQATAAGLGQPYGVAVDSAGDLFVADTDNFVVREVNLSSGVITTVAGNGIPGNGGDGGQATAAELDTPAAVAVDSSGDLFIVDQRDNRIREVNLSSGLITAFAGNGRAGDSGDGGPATAAELSAPSGVAADSTGDVYIADTMNNEIRVVAQSIQLSTTLVTHSAIGTYGGTTTLTATLSSSDVDVAGETVVFTLDGSTVGSATTDGRGVATLSGVSLAGINAGGYAEYVGASFAGDSIYAGSTADAKTLVVSQATLTVTANDASRVYGGADPTFTAAITGFVAGEVLATSGVTGSPSLTSTDNSASPVGTYPITATLGTLAAQNYTFTFVNGTLTVSAPPTGDSTIGAYDPATATFYLRNSNTSGCANETFNFGWMPASNQRDADSETSAPALIPLSGDWIGQGYDTVGLYDPSTSTFYLTTSNATGCAQITFGFGWVPAAGRTALVPVAGDWTGQTNSTTGCPIDTVGLYDPSTSTFYLRNSNTTGTADITASLGAAGMMPVVGDWQGNGTTLIGVMDPTTSQFYLAGSNATGYAAVSFGYGNPNSGWTAIAGDWTAQGLDTVGLVDPTNGLYYLRNSNTTGCADITVGYGVANAGWVPIAGQWVPAQQQLVTGGSITASVPLPTLTEGQLRPVVQAAIANWAAAGASSQVLSAMDSAQIEIKPLPNGELGVEYPTVIYLDPTAQGYGWYVDPTPKINSEFAPSSTAGQLAATVPAAVGHVDLLTVVEHELGHVGGLDDRAASNSLMSTSLAPGLRRLPSTLEAQEIDAALGG